MKKLSLLIVIVLTLTILTSCYSKKAYENFETFDNGVTLKHGDITYEFVSAVSNSSFIGEQFGIVNGDERDKILYVKGYSSDEWIIEYYDVIMSTYSLYKADTVTDIPDELLSH